MTTIANWLKQATAELTQAHAGSEQLDAELILGHVLGHNRAWIKAHGADRLPAHQSAAAGALIKRRAQREPLVHLTGQREFYGLEFEITPDVLTPRIETEQMVEWAVRHAPQGGRLIDIGTGSGAIAIATAKHRPDLHVTSTDISEAALAVARRNATRHKVAVDFIASDLWSQVPQSAAFDVVVTNLPYLRDDAAPDLMPEVQHEPAIALFGGPDGLDLYRRFLAGLPAHLAPDGLLFTECDPWQHEALIAEASRYGLIPLEQGYFILGFRSS